MKKIIYYENELEDEFAGDNIRPKAIDEAYDYDGGIGRRIGRHLLYGVLARPIAYIYLKLMYSHKIVNRPVIRDTMKRSEYKGKGFFLYGNHTNNIADALIPSMICMPRYVSVIVHPNNVSMPVLGRATPALGAVPLPDDKKAMINFMKSLEKRVKDLRECVTIYPEAHIWPYYTHIRPFVDKSFGYPVKYGTPVFCFTNTYHKRLIGTRIITYVDGPFFADESLSVIENRKRLRDAVYDTMVEKSEHNTYEKIQYIKKL